MKKILAVVIVLVTLLSISSCKKEDYREIDYHYVGIYVNIMGSKERTMDDNNLKLYADIEKNIVVDSNNVVGYCLITESIAHVIDFHFDHIVSLAGNYSIVDIYDKVNTIELYPIIYREGKLEIHDTELETMTLEEDETVSKSILKKYKYNGTEYQFQGTIKILKKEKK